MGGLPFLPLFEPVTLAPILGAHMAGASRRFDIISIVSFSALPTFKRVSSAKI
jgi:hypothetical protein